MKTTFWHGTNGTRLHSGETGRLASPDGLPLHGIAPLGLLPWLRERADGVDLWHRQAAGLGSRDVPLSPELDELRAAAYDAGVLTFEQSARVAAQYAAATCPSATELRIWNTKEGHTASVWEITLVGVGDGAGSRFVVNVARDTRSASADLRCSSDRLRRLGRARGSAVRVAEVRDLDTVVVPPDPEALGAPEGARITVTRNELVVGAREIHDVPGAGYVLVEEFLTDRAAGADPAKIRSVRGRRVTQRQHALISRTVRELGERITVNEGDLVWDGREPVVVAVT